MNEKIRGYATSTLLRMTKNELLQYIRCLESTIENLEFMTENQYKILMEFDSKDLHEAYKKAHLKEAPKHPDCANCPVLDVNCYEQCRRDEKRDVK